jgi:repressor LexA
MLPELTQKQGHFLAYLEHEIARRGTTPSLRQAAVKLGVSHAAVKQLIGVLEEKGYVKRDGRYSRNLYLLNRAGEAAGLQRWREVPIIGKVAAGRPMYAQEQWEGSLVVDSSLYPGTSLFALQIKGDSMKNASILDHDLVICEPRQFAHNGEIVVALIHQDEATVKRFYKRKDHIELRPENDSYPLMKFGFDEVLIQGKVVGVQRGPAQTSKL